MNPINENTSKAQFQYTVVIPARNEEENIARCIASVITATEKVSGATDILVIDDNSSDETAIRARASGARVIHHETQSGPLAAWATGVASSTTSYIVFIDADCTVDEDAFARLMDIVKLPGVGVASGRSIPIEDNSNVAPEERSVLVKHSAAFSCALLDEIKSRLGDHDFTAIGRLMAVRREAWNVTNTKLAHCDREVASAARQIGWRAVYVPEAKVYYHAPASFSELRSDWARTRRALDRSSQIFDDIPWSVQLSAAWAALRAAPLDGLCWVSSRSRLIIGPQTRTSRSSFRPPYTWP